MLVISNARLDALIRGVQSARKKWAEDGGDFSDLIEPSNDLIRAAMNMKSHQAARERRLKADLDAKTKSKGMA